MLAKVCILRTDGTNCDTELAHAFTLAGGKPEFVHVNEFGGRPRKLEEYNILALPGGFSYGDDVQSGKILAVELRSRLRDQIQKFVADWKLVIGICNGFQVLVQTGLLPFGTLGEQKVTLTGNDSGKFECRWVRMNAWSSGPCVFTRDIPSVIELPVAHGEGKFFAEPEVLRKVETGKLVALRYANGGTSGTQEYPANPNGSLDAIAGVCDPTGRIFGLMPHPERYVERTQHPNWRREGPEERKPDGRWIFENAVQFAK